MRPASPRYQNQGNQVKEKKGKQKSISLMNIDVNTLNNIVMECNGTLKGSSMMIKWDLFWWWKGFSVSSNQPMWYVILTNEEWKPYDNLNSCRKLFRKNLLSIYDKNSPGGRHRGNLLNIIKAWSITANIILNKEKYYL